MSRLRRRRGDNGRLNTAGLRLRQGLESEGLLGRTSHGGDCNRPGTIDRIDLDGRRTGQPGYPVDIVLQIGPTRLDHRQHFQLVQSLVVAFAFLMGARGGVNGVGQLQLLANGGGPAVEPRQLLELRSGGL